MDVKEILKILDEIHWSRMLEAHHDSFDLHQPDLEALDCVINLLKILQESRLDDTITIGELMAAANIDK